MLHLNLETQYFRERKDVISVLKLYCCHTQRTRLWKVPNDGDAYGVKEHGGRRDQYTFCS